MKGYFRLKRGAVLQWKRSYYQWIADPFHTENKELGLKEEKYLIYFDSKNNDGSPRIIKWNILPRYYSGK
jgi:hypothetical protein